MRRAPSKRLVLLMSPVVALALVLLFAACTRPVVELRDDSGTTLSLHLEDVFEVSLRSSPSTGYRWSRMPDGAGDAPGVLVQVGDPTFTADSDLADAPGTVRFRFKAAGLGDTTLRLEYRPAQTTDEAPQRTFEVHVHVE